VPNDTRRCAPRTLQERRAGLEAALAAKTVEREQLPALLGELRTTPIGAAIADTIVEAADTVVERLTLALLELDG
jgi:hypothetical protein